MVKELQLLETFRDARSLGAAWDTLARNLTQLESSSSTDQHGRSWAKVAAELSGYNVNLLRQMQRTLGVLEALHADSKQVKLAKTLHGISYSHLEILARIAKIDSQAAIAHLLAFATEGRQPTYRELRNEFYRLREARPQASPIAAGLKTSRQFEDLCLGLLKSGSYEDLFGDGVTADLTVTIRRWPGGFRYASPDFIVELRNKAGGIVQVDAADCFTIYGDVGQDETTRRIKQVAVEATFFNAFWVMLPTWSPVSLFDLERAELALQNVGIAVVDVGRRLISDVLRPSGLPQPDRRHLLHRQFSI